MKPRQSFDDIWYCKKHSLKLRGEIRVKKNLSLTIVYSLYISEPQKKRCFISWQGFRDFFVLSSHQLLFSVEVLRE